MVVYGRDIWLWQDNWHPAGPLVRRHGSRIVYDSASRIDARVQDFLTRIGGGYLLWCLMISLKSLLICLVILPIWMLNIRWNGFSLPMSNFLSILLGTLWGFIILLSSGIALFGIKTQFPDAALCWGWCAGTKDKLLQWGCVNESGCILCGNAIETRDHLLVICPVFFHNWKVVLSRLGIAGT